MLVLNRKRNESLWIGSEIEVTVLEVSNSRVRLGIAAPTQHRIRRHELPPAVENKQQTRWYATEGEKNGSEPETETSNC